MATVTVFTAERMQEIEDQAIIGGSIVGGHLILERNNGETVDAGAIDVSLLGDLGFALDDDTYYRYTDAAGPFALTTNVITPMSNVIMDTDDGDPPWGHWDTDDDNRFIFDTAGFYNVYSYINVDSSGTGTGHSELWLTDSQGSAISQAKHESGFDVRPEAQLTTLYEVGQSVRVDVRTQGALNVTYAELYIRKLNVVMEGSAVPGGGGGGGGVQTPWASDIDAADYNLQNVGAIWSTADVVGATGTTQTLDISSFGVFNLTMDANCTFTFSNPPPSGTVARFTVILRGAFTPTWPGTVDWASGTAPTYATPSVYVFITVDGGTTYLGFLSGSGIA